MSNLADLVEAFKREVSIPGNFQLDFPTTTDDDLAAALMDAFGEAKLDGFFGSVTLDPNSGVTTPDLSVAGAALLVIYAGIRMTRIQLRALKTATRYKAGPVEYDIQSSASSVTEDLKQLERRKQAIIEGAVRAGRGRGTTFVIDGYVSRQGTYDFYGGLFPYEYYSAEYSRV